MENRSAIAGRLPSCPQDVEDWRGDRIGSALRGTNPTVMARLPAGFAVIGDVQWLPGYCVLLSDDPGVTRLSDLSPTARSAYLDGVAALAEAVERACGAADPAFRRVNVEILGNADDFLRTHVWPRYAWEPPELVRRPVWLYPLERWNDPATALGPQHDVLRAAITRNLAAARGPVGQPGRSAVDDLRSDRFCDAAADDERYGGSAPS